jgi:hypothetical protein
LKSRERIELSKIAFALLQSNAEPFGILDIWEP